MINNHAKLGVKCAIESISGVIGIDDDNDKLSCINFKRIKGGKPFNTNKDWFKTLLKEIDLI